MEGTNSTLTMDDSVYVRDPEYFLALQWRLSNTALEEFREYAWYHVMADRHARFIEVGRAGNSNLERRTFAYRIVESVTGRRETVVPSRDISAGTFTRRSCAFFHLTRPGIARRLVAIYGLLVRVSCVHRQRVLETFFDFGGGDGLLLFQSTQSRTFGKLTDDRVGVGLRMSRVRVGRTWLMSSSLTSLN